MGESIKGTWWVVAWYFHTRTEKHRLWAVHNNERAARLHSRLIHNVDDRVHIADSFDVQCLMEGDPPDRYWKHTMPHIEAGAEDIPTQQILDLSKALGADDA